MYVIPHISNTILNFFWELPAISFETVPQKSRLEAQSLYKFGKLLLKLFTNYIASLKLIRLYAAV